MNNKQICITKIFTFDSAHRLINYDGECSNLHGHTYKLEVTVKGEVKANGLVIDFKDLKNIVQDSVISVVDHKYLNDIFDFNPTCELLGLWIWDVCEVKFVDFGCQLEKITLWETPTSYVTINR